MLVTIRVPACLGSLHSAFMRHHAPQIRRRALSVLVVAVVLFALVSLLRARLADVYTRVFGIPLETVLTVSSSIAAVAVGATFVAWLRTLPRRAKVITLRELRRQAGYRR